MAQANNVDETNHTVSMTVSFSLDYEHCRHARPTVLYGRQSTAAAAELQSSSSPEGRVRGEHPRQFNYTSAHTTRENENGMYQSDWIYHVELPNLQAGRQEYWYRIIVQEEDKEEELLEHQQELVGDMRLTRRSPLLSQQQQRRSLRGSAGYYLGETRTYALRTPPLPHAPTTLALVGDLGQTTDSSRTVFAIYKDTLTPQPRSPVATIPNYNHLPSASC